MAFVEAGLRYLRKGGTLAFVITSKVQQTLPANIMRRTLTSYKIVRLIDYSLWPKPLFKGAVNYPLILVVKKEPPKDSRIEVTITNTRGERRSWLINQNELQLTEGDPESPWMMAPPEVIKCFRKMQRSGPRLGDVMEVAMGVKTSANDIFLVKELSHTATPGVFLAKTEGGRSVRIEDSLLRPMIRGENISAWRFDVNEWIIWTHDDTGDVPKNLPPEANRYFNDSDIVNKLARRDDYRTRQPIWIIFRVSSHKLTNKVAWHELATRMEAVFMEAYYDDPTLGTRKLIPIQTVYFVPVGNEDVGYALTAF